MTEEVKEEAPQPEELIITINKTFFEFTLEELKQIPVKFGEIMVLNNAKGSIAVGLSWTQIIRIVNKAAGEPVLTWKTTLSEAMPLINRVFQL